MELHSTNTTIKGTTTYYSYFSKGRVDDKTLNLTEAELDQDIPCLIESVDPQGLNSTCLFNYMIREYVPGSPSLPIITLLHLPTAALLRGSPAALEENGAFLDINELYISTRDGGNLNRIYNDDRMAAGNTKFCNKKIPNAFNYCEQGVSAAPITFRFASTETQPPLRSVFNSQISFSTIYDAYITDSAKIKSRIIEWEQENIKEATLIVDRVLCQNIYDEVGFDFQYYNDIADEFRSTGSLLPLWHFRLPSYIGLVTDLKWNMQYPDLFVATFKAINSDEDDFGAVVQFSLKNPSYPEYIQLTESVALCVGVHPSLSYLIVVGFSSGSVAVFDTAAGKKLYQSDYLNNHTRGVSSVYFGTGEEYCFYSVSFDGNVKIWTFIPTCLSCNTLFTLHPTQVRPDDAFLKVHDFGYTFTHHPTEKNIYLVGTVTGNVIQCSALQSVDYLFLYAAHQMPVSRIAFNPFIPRIFLTCSPDSTVKIWENMHSDFLMVFDLGSPVIDADWSPFTSTVFAAVTEDGRALVFDLNQSQSNPVCEQNVVSVKQQNGPTKICFNTRSPILLIGDERGSVMSFKLSPNLRIPVKQSKKEWVEPRQLEIGKLEKILVYMKPKILELPNDKPFLE